MHALESDLRKQLETAVLAARRAAEGASRAALDGLGVFLRDKPGHLDADQSTLRNGLRAKWRQLGEDRALLVAECAYEQWHRLLFARFLAENKLLLHPQYKAPVTLADCDELAAQLGEPDGWSVAARFAAQILPGIFPLEDPSFRLRLAPEGRHALEQILEGLPPRVFVADDALGWVYQFWQEDKKDEINASERKIGGADLGPVTQLFTENYMVRFLLENSLGSWWASRYPDSPLVKDYKYLRFAHEDQPAAGAFDGWPGRVAEVTVIDPCCGSGHFLVEAFSMLWQMRAEEDGLPSVEAQDAVLRDNLFGLELDPRCVQIAMFAVALQAWKAGSAWRQLPVPNIACTGIPVKASAEEWKALAKGDSRLETALTRLHVLFRNADTLGSLIDPRGAAESADPNGLQRSFEDVDWREVTPLLEQAAVSESRDPAAQVLGADAAATARAANLLSSSYTLVVTNVPYLSRSKQGELLKDFADAHFRDAKADLSTVFIERCRRFAAPGGSDATVTPQNWLFLGTYAGFRRKLLIERVWNMVGRVGLGATSTKSWDTLRALLIATNYAPASDQRVVAVDAFTAYDESRSDDLRRGRLRFFEQRSQLANPASIVSTNERAAASELSEYASSPQGVKTGDDARFRQAFWEQPTIQAPWRRYQGTVSETVDFGGCESIVRWEGNGEDIARPQGQSVWSREGVVVSLMRSLPVARYLGEAFDSNVGVLVPDDPEHLPAIWAFASAPDYNDCVRELDPGLRVVNASLIRVPFDLAYWQAIAAKQYPDGLPAPQTADPTQWLFEGNPAVATACLQAAVARLLGYRWPGRVDSDGVGKLTDADGIVCLPPVAGEPPAADRLQQLLAATFGPAWTLSKAREVLEQAGSKRKALADWLRDEFFKQHCALFGNRPFIWHIWDGLRDGFSALVNYHGLDRKKLEKLTYTYLGQDWVERQRAAARDDVAGAEVRLSAAVELQRKLEAILEGEQPFDVYVRWKDLDEQPLGWEPDINDGVRLNIRPFVEAGVLRSSFNVHWKKDRGKNPDGSERHNNVHLSLAEKRDARKQAERS